MEAIPKGEIHSNVLLSFTPFTLAKNWLKPADIQPFCTMWMSTIAIYFQQKVGMPILACLGKSGNINISRV